MTAQADSAPRAARRNLRLASPILLGATTAVGAVMLSVAVLPADSLMRERRDLLFGLSAIAGLVGGFVGPRVVAGSLIGALARGGAAGYGWFVSTAAFVLMVAYVDSMERGVFATGLTAPLAWTLYFLAIAAFVGALVTIPVGIGWALAVWLIARVAPRQGRSATTPRGAKAVGTTAISVVVLGMVSGTVQARLTAPPSAQCLNLGGETAVAGAWSPDGSEFAVASTHDPNQEGHVRLFAWPSQTLLAEWTGWVDQTVAVDAAAHVYWSAWALDNSGPPGGSSGVLIAEPGADPVWLSTDQAHEAALWDLVWSAGELKGRTANLHHGAAIAVSGPDSGRVRKLPTVDDPLGAFWSSPDGRWTVSAPDRDTDHVSVEHDGGVQSVPYSGSPRSVAMTPDRRSVVIADWSGGTVAIELSTGARRILLAGSQRWIAVSPRGEIAWSNEADDAPGNVCIASLSHLPAA